MEEKKNVKRSSPMVRATIYSSAERTSNFQQAMNNMGSSFS